MPRSALLGAAIASLLAITLPTGAQAQKSGPPGQFDYYVLSLSWSPTYCAEQGERGDSGQCGTHRRFGFVVHGLWPQHAGGGYPASCMPRSNVPRSIIEDMLPIMPSPGLISHEWQKHGTCSGMGATKYFEKTRAAFDRVKIPESLKKPESVVSLSVEGVEALFAKANPGLTGDMLGVMCRRQYVSEIQVCLDKDLSFRKCGNDVRDRCRKGESIFRPLK